MSDETKQCSRCKKLLPLSDFHHRTNGSRIGHVSQCKLCEAKRKKAYIKSKYRPGHLRRKREAAYRRTYGVTLRDYEELLKKQDGRCAICGTDKPGKRFKHFAIDHCHQTGEVRGLLCNCCNAALGYFGDDLNVLLKAVRYMQTSMARESEK